MHTVIIGAGAMGSLIGYLLFRAGAQVDLIERDPAIVRAINAEGLRVEGVSGGHIVPLRVRAEAPDGAAADMIFVLVKAQDTAAAIETIRPLVSSRTVAVTWQNGVGSERLLGEALGRERVIAGVTNLGASLLAPGHVLHTSWGGTTLAALEPAAHDRAESAASFLTRHGLKTTVTADAASMLWGKVIVNVGVSAITTLARVRNGRLLDVPAAKELMHAAVKEAQQVLELAQIKLPYRNPLTQIEQSLGRTADSLSATLQDHYRGRPTEIDFINGAVVRLAEELSLDAPINRTLTLLVKTAESAN